VKLLGLLRADADSAGTPPSAELVSRMGDFIEEVTKNDRGTIGRRAPIYSMT
jgi:hypothetical protein